ncbi:hypothetical protein R1flu_007541 [Riccia fluitans]|uniref:Uncharacterized protein n=1 Tax=Riccia fluitans TaxID=41844 RepID=A0ABD1YZ66_9MARC
MEELTIDYYTCRGWREPADTSLVLVASEVEPATIIQLKTSVRGNKARAGCLSVHVVWRFCNIRNSRSRSSLPVSNVGGEKGNAENSGSRGLENLAPQDVKRERTDASE